MMEDTSTLPQLYIDMIADRYEDDFTYNVISILTTEKDRFTTIKYIKNDMVEILLIIEDTIFRTVLLYELKSMHDLKEVT